MKLEDFKAGSFINQYEYKIFLPNKINENWVWEDAMLNSLLSKANLGIGELNVFSMHIPNIDYFIKSHIAKEASTSSKIEGTRTNFTEALMDESEIDPERRNDWREVRNYIEAMNYAISAMHKIPLSNRLLKKCHEILMGNVRGSEKNPGGFRRSQNWIGGATLNDAVFIPPLHTEVADLMGDLEKFLHNRAILVPELIRIAIAHYQFETIHPFLDGNGRLGRLLITLYLVSTGLLKHPTLYISDYFEKNRTLYYENLNQVRFTNNLIQWIKFFLAAVIDTTAKGILTFQKIFSLKEEIENKRLLNIRKERAAKARTLIEYLYKNPFINSNTAARVLKISPATANSLIKNLVELKILREITGKRRNRYYVFQEYVNLFTD